MRTTAGQGSEFRLDTAARERLTRHAEAAVRRARRAGEGLAAVTIALDGSADPAAIVAASRAADEPWFVLEHPDAAGTAVAAQGCVRALESSGPDRFRDVARTWRSLAAEAAADPIDGPPGSGLVAVGGFAFAPDGGSARHWAGYAPASLHVPEVAIARQDGETRLTVCASSGAASAHTVSRVSPSRRAIATSGTCSEAGA